MINFLIGLAAGVAAALISHFARGKANTKPEEKTGNSAEQERLNREKKERERRIAELERQHAKMMEYTGKEQRRE